MQWKSFAQAGTLPFRPPHLQIYVPLAFCVFPWWPFPQRCCTSPSHHQALRVQSMQARKAQEEAMAQGKPQAAPPSLAGCVEEGRRRTRASKQKPKPSRLSFIKMLLRFSHKKGLRFRTDFMNTFTNTNFVLPACCTHPQKSDRMKLWRALVCGGDASRLLPPHASTTALTTHQTHNTVTHT